MANNALPRMANARVIVALMLREMTTRYGKSYGGYLWAFFEPVGMIAILSVVFGFAVRTPSLGENFPLFFATGFLGFHFYMEMAQYASSAINKNRALLNYPRVTPIDAILARCLLQFATLSIVSIVILAGIVIVFDIHTIYDWVSMLKAVGLASLLGMGTGSMNAYLFGVLPTYQNVWRILTRPLFLISGIFFIYEDMPPVVQDVMWWNPILHATGLMRRGFYPSYHGAYISEVYIAAFGLPLLAAGLFFVYRNRSAHSEKT